MNNKKPLYIFLLLLPFIDLITSLSTRFFPFPISLGVIVKTIFLIAMLIYLIFKSTSKYKKLSISYMSLIFIYILIYIITKIKYLTFTQFINESMYLIKICYYPLLLLSLKCYFDDKKISKEELQKILFINILTYIFLLALPLITHTGFDTYRKGALGTIGWFYSANEIALICILLFPFMFTKLNKGFKYYILIILSIIVLSTIGTKVSMLGIIVDIILLLVSLYKNKDKKLIIKAISLLLISFIVLSQSSSLSNYKSSTYLQSTEGNPIKQKNNNKEDKQNNNTDRNNNKVEYKKEEETTKIIKSKTTTKKTTSTTTTMPVTMSQEERLLNEEYDRIKKEEYKNSKSNTKFEKFCNKYLKALLSDRDIYYKVTYGIYKQQFSIKTLLFGMGYSNTSQIKNYAITKLIEIDPIDILFHSGLIALIIVLLPFIYYIIKLIKNKKLTINIIFYTLMLGLIFCISCISGHTLFAPAVSIYLCLYFILAYTELGLINKKQTKIEKNKVSIYALHLNYGGVEKNIIEKANMLCDKYKVEIISLYKLTDKPAFDLNNKVKVKYLTTNIKPNREEFKLSLKSKNIINIIKEGLYSIKVLYLKNNLISRSMIDCNSEIIISTRIDFTLKLIKNNEFNSIKIAEEHIYHNNNSKYLNSLYKVLNNIDYLMPSSDYLTNYYKEIFIKYSNKIVTNNMPITTDNKVSKLVNKTIISVGRLSKEKAFDELIYVFNEVHKTNSAWNLKIVGNGTEYDYLQDLINKLDLNNNVELLGYKTTEELNTLYSESDLYVMTSIEESFGLVLLEAASHGLPIIAYSCALGAKEILSNNKGILIDKRSRKMMVKSINNLINENKLMTDYQKKSLSISEKYNYEIIKEMNINFFKNIKSYSMYNTLYKDSKNSCYKLIESKLKNKEKTFIITANPETYMISEKDSDINKIINDNNNLIVPDGIAIVKSANFLGYNLKERITGVDIAEYLLELANKNKYKVYLFGASEDVMNKLELVISEKYSNINLVGSSNGYIKDKDAVMEYIKTTNPDIVMLALGIPLQEKLIYNHIADFNKGIFIGVGGAFDVLSGTKKRAHEIFIKNNLEWLYRIIKEPKRLIRFMKNNIRFLLKVLKQKNK